MLRPIPLSDKPSVQRRLEPLRRSRGRSSAPLDLPLRDSRRGSMAPVLSAGSCGRPAWPGPTASSARSPSRTGNRRCSTVTTITQRGGLPSTAKLAQLRIGRDRGAAVDPDRLADAGDQEQQRDARVADDVAQAVDAVVAAPVGDQQRLLVGTRTKPGGSPRGEQSSPPGRRSQARRTAPPRSARGSAALMWSISLATAGRHRVGYMPRAGRAW